MKIVILFFLLIAAGRLWAADGGTIPTPAQKLPPKLVKTPQGTYQIDFQDGRVAGIMQSTGQPLVSTVGLRQIENTCDHAQILAECRIEASFANRVLEVKWVQHPDTAKLGQVVILKASRPEEQDEKLRENAYLLTWFDTTIETDTDVKLKPDRIVCDTLAWAQDIPTQDGKIVIQNWSAETMSETQETGLNENQPMADVFNTVLKVVDNKTLEFHSFGPSNTLGSFPPYVSSQVTSLTFLNKKNQQCQVSFENNIEKLIRDFQDPVKNQIDPRTERYMTQAAHRMSLTILGFYLRVISGNSYWNFE